MITLMVLFLCVFVGLPSLVAVLLVSKWDDFIFSSNGHSSGRWSVLAASLTIVIAAHIGFFIAYNAAQNKRQGSYNSEKAAHDRRFVQEYLVKNVPEIAGEDPGSVFFEEDATEIYVLVRTGQNEVYVTDSEIIRVVDRYTQAYGSFQSRNLVLCALQGSAGAFVAALVAGLLRVPIVLAIQKIIKKQRRAAVT